jgi:hypothetical protein
MSSRHAGFPAKAPAVIALSNNRVTPSLKSLKQQFIHAKQQRRVAHGQVAYLLRQTDQLSARSRRKLAEGRHV